ncbi:MAG: site-2 protease family protein [Hyphomonadaceae bacterium]
MAAGGLRIGAFAGAAIIVDWSVALLAGYIILSGLDEGGVRALPAAFAFLAAILSAILIHEFGHAGVAAALKLPSKRIVLSFMGGHVEFAHPPRTRWHDIAVSAAGPLANLATAAVLFPLMPQFGALPPYVALFFANLFVVSAFLGVLNLLPGFPLDGGRILTALLSYWLHPLRARFISGIAGLLIAAAAAYWGYANQAWWTLGIAILLVLAAISEIRFTSAALRAPQGDGGRSNT